MASQDAGHRCKTKCQQRFYSVHYTTFRPRKPRGRHFFWKPGRGDADAGMGERPWSCLESKVVWAEAHIWGTGGTSSVSLTQRPWRWYKSGKRNLLIWESEMRKPRRCWHYIVLVASTLLCVCRTGVVGDYVFSVRGDQTVLNGKE